MSLSGSALLAGAAAAGAVAARRGCRGERRLAHLGFGGRSKASPAHVAGHPVSTSASSRGARALVVRALAVAGPAAATAVLLGGLLGAAGAVVVAVTALRWLTRADRVPVLRARRRAAADLPLAVDLVCACLEAGAAPSRALAAVADAVGQPLGRPLREVVSAFAMGASPSAAWAQVATDEVLGEVLSPLAHVLATGSGSGARQGPALRRLAVRLRADLAADGAAAAQSVGVRAVAPLGLCFLPAFVLLGIVPTAWGLVARTFGAA